MQIAVLVEQNSEQRFVATGSAPFAISAEADTAEEAVQLLRAMISERIAQGATIATIDVPAAKNPWLAGAGMFRGDAFFKACQEEMTNYRRSENQAIERP